MMRFLRWVGIAAVLGYLTYLATLAPHVGYLVAAVLCYVLTGYVLWRAWPAIRSDLDRLRARRVKLLSPGRYSRGGDL